MKDLTKKEIDNILFILRSSEFDEEQKAYSKSMIINRLNYLQPLIKELQDKGYMLSEVSRELNNEYKDLIFIRNRFIV